MPGRRVRREKSIAGARRLRSGHRGNRIRHPAHVVEALTWFDLPEAESELVAGYQVEYSSTPFLLFMAARGAGMHWSYRHRVAPALAAARYPD